MDAFLDKITYHAMNYAIRSGIGITASYAIGQTSRLLRTVEDKTDRQKLQKLQARLDSKIKIISPAIDLIELISARGNTTLESAVSLTKALRWDIQSLGERLAKAATAEEESRKNYRRSRSSAIHNLEIHNIVQNIQDLLAKIEDAVPLINLAITTSGAKLSTTLPATVSPSRLLQASTFLTAGDTQYSMNPAHCVQIGSTLTLSIYMLFSGHTHRNNYQEGAIRDTTWQEVIHKARLKLVRVPLREAYDLKDEELTLEKEGTGNSTEKVTVDQRPRYISGNAKASEFSYQLQIVEDFDDDRVHSFDDHELQPGHYDGVDCAGIRETLPIFQISKIFYADTGKILNIGGEGDTNNPVLLLKRDIDALPPRNMMQAAEDNDLMSTESRSVGSAEDNNSQDDEVDSQDDIDQQLHREISIIESDITETKLAEEIDREWRFPADLDPEWLAFEVYTEDESSDSEDEQNESSLTSDMSLVYQPLNQSEELNSEQDLTSKLENLNLNHSTNLQSAHTSPIQTGRHQKLSPKGGTSQEMQLPPVRSSLSLLEMLIRLTALQQFQQASHLSIPDEMLTFFLEESSTTGAGGDGEARRQTRNDARRRVGFDPYDESPVKRRGEEYLTRTHDQDQDDGYDTELYSPRISTPGTRSLRNSYPYLGDDINNLGWQRHLSQGSSRTRNSISAFPDPKNRLETPSPRARVSRDDLELPKTPDSVSSPVPNYRASRSRIKPTNPSNLSPLDSQHDSYDIKASKRTKSSMNLMSKPQGRGASAEPDSSLGTSPGSPMHIRGGSKSEEKI